MKRLSNIMLIVAIVMSATMVYPVSANAQQRNGRPTATTASAKQVQKERQKAQKAKQKEREQKMKEKAKRQQELQKQKEKQQKEAAKAKKQSQKQAASKSSSKSASAKATATTQKTTKETAKKETSKKVTKQSAKETAKAQTPVEEPILTEDLAEVSDEVIEETPAKREKVVLIDTEEETLEYIPGEEEEAEKPEKENKQMSPAHIVGFGVKGGVASFLPQSTNPNWPASRPGNLGFSGSGELSYTFLMQNDRQVGVGVRTGVSVGYTMSGQNVYLLEEQTITDPLSNEYQYTITADQVREVNAALLVEVPLMLALKIQGFYFNAGVKFQIPLMPKYWQYVKNPNVDAYLAAYDVHFENSTATGVINDEDCYQTGTWTMPKMNLLLAGELGYYIPVTEHFLIGLGFYGDYNIYNSYKNDAAAGKLFTITGVGEGPTSAKVQVGTLSQNYTTKLGFFDFGAKISFNYAF